MFEWYNLILKYEFESNIVLKKCVPNLYLQTKETCAVVLQLEKLFGEWFFNVFFFGSSVAETLYQLMQFSYIYYYNFFR